MIDGLGAINSGLLLSFLLVVFLRRNYLESIGWAIFGGLLMDYFSQAPLGFYIINFTILIFLVDILKRKIALKEMHFSTVSLIVFAGVIVSDILATLFFSFLSWVKITSQMQTFNFSIKYFFVSMVLSVVGLLFYQLIIFIERVFGIGSREIKIDKM